MFLTILLGLTAAVCWGAPDVWLAQATRNLGPFPVVFGAVLIGLVVIAPAALFVDTAGLVLAWACCSLCSSAP